MYWILRRPYRDLVDHNPHVDVVLDEYSVLYSINEKAHVRYGLQLPCDRSKAMCIHRQIPRRPISQIIGDLPDNVFNYGRILESFTRIAGHPIINIAPSLYIPERAVQVADQLNLPAHYIVTYCHSIFTPKDWRSHHWEKLIDDLIRTFGIKVVEVGLRSILTGHQSASHNLCGRISLLETAEIIKRTDYFIDMDSGPAHFANSVGTFGFLLFGKLGNFTTYMPYSGDYQAITNVQFILSESGQPCSELSYEVVWSVVHDTIRQREQVGLMNNGPMSFRNHDGRIHAIVRLLLRQILLSDAYFANTLIVGSQNVEREVVEGDFIARFGQATE